MNARGESGRADAVALAAAVLLAAAAVAPAVLLRLGKGWVKCREEVLAPHNPPDRVVNPVAGPLVAAESARTLVATALFRPDPSRSMGTGPSEPGGAPAVPAAAVRDLAGRIAEGTLFLRWIPTPGSRGTLLRVEGLGGPWVWEKEIPSGRGDIEIPIPGAAGTVVARATPAGTPGRAVEANVTMEFRIPSEAVRAASANRTGETALLVLRRPYDGRMVEGEFPVSTKDEGPVGGSSSVGPGGPVVDFLTDLRLVGILEGTEVPRFQADGRVARDAAGRPATAFREGPGDLRVVLRGPDDRSRVLRVEGGDGAAPADRGE